MKLTWKAFDKAKDFIRWHARPLERAIFSYYFHGESGENVLAELAKFQNPDGGFGNALEPDVRMPDSSVIATTVGLQILREMKVPQSYHVVKVAIQYLLDTYDAEREGWEIVPIYVDQYPHAPWWKYDEEVRNSLNPVAEIVGYFFDYADLVPKEMRDNLLSKVISQINEKVTLMDMHEFLCCVSLVETENLPEESRSMIMHKLRWVVESIVERTPSQWDGYVLKPLMVVKSPDSPFEEMLASEIEANLDYEINRQNEEGFWSPNWSWGGLFPETWIQAEADWKGVLTVRNLISLSKFSRIEK